MKHDLKTGMRNAGEVVGLMERLSSRRRSHATIKQYGGSQVGQKTGIESVGKKGYREHCEVNTAGVEGKKVGE